MFVTIMLSSLKKMEDRDLILKNGPYFMGLRGMYLNRWTLDFDHRTQTPRFPLEIPKGSILINRS